MVFFRCSFRPEVTSDVISGANIGKVATDVLLNLMILAKTVLEICSSESVGSGIFDRFLNFDNFRPEVYN